ncbi:MAG: DUF502 domain-containing protein [Halobacteriales archaeon]|nr:DUF502 domain-containing protein [Halobacteriales archaeon]
MFPSSWKRDFASGLVVLVPVLATVFVITYLYDFVFDAITRTGILDNYETIPAGAYVPLALVFFLLLVLAIGYLMRTTVGDIIERALDDVFNAIPGLRIIYNASKMAAETAFSGTGDLQSPVKLEVWEGLRMTAFKTGKTTEDGRDVLFLPTSPNITTGFVVEVESSDYEETDESVEDALTRVLSAGFGENEPDIPEKMLHD